MNNEHVTAVKKALDLSILISESQEKLNCLSRERFDTKPQPPSHKTATCQYPEIKPKTPFWSIQLLPAIFFWPWIIIYYFTIYKKRKEADIEQIRNSPEYLQQCTLIEEEAKRNQKKFDEEYQIALEEYNTVILPKYQKALEEWTSKHNKKIADTETILKNAESNLAEHYEATKIVPLQYRKIEMLQYIYDMISTSDYSIKEAIEMYDKERQRRLEEERIYEQQRANQLADEQNQLAYDQNELLDQQNRIADRARKDARNAAVVNAVQRHNTNKTLKNAFKK